MKTKLLRKVRKRFQIFHLPNGYVDYEGYHYNYNLFKLCDSDGYENYAQVGIIVGRNYCGAVFESEKEALAYLKNDIIRILRMEGHRNAKDKQRSIKKKVWYVE